MNKKLKITYSTLIVFILFFHTNLAYSWGPMTHIHVCSDSLDACKDSSIVKNIILYDSVTFQYFMTGLMFPDVTVIYYYTEWKNYQTTHAWGRYENLWDVAERSGSKQAMAFALGWGTHLVQDTVAHNVYVPMKIRTTLVLNNIIHPLSEGVIETKCMEENPWLWEDAITSFNYWNVRFTDGDETINGKTPVQLVEEVIGTTLDWFTLCSQFQNILEGGGFSGSFKGYSFEKQSGALWSLYKGIATVAKYTLCNEEPAPYLNETVKRTVEWWTSGSPKEAKTFALNQDPTGGASLASADSFVSNITTVILITFVSIVISYYYRKMRRK